MSPPTRGALARRESHGVSGRHGVELDSSRGGTLRTLEKSGRRQEHTRPARGSDLRVVEGRRLAPSGALVALSVVFAVMVLFAVVAFHTVLVANQSEVDHLERRISEETRTREQLTLLEAELSSPDRVVSAARDDLGMVVPEQVVWLEPVEVSTAPDSTAPDSTAPENTAPENTTPVAEDSVEQGDAPLDSPTGRVDPDR